MVFAYEPAMTGRKACIRNDWRVGDILENKRQQRILITAIGVDYVLVYRKTFENEIYTRLDEVDTDWRLVSRPRKLIGWRVKLTSDDEYMATPLTSSGYNSTKRMVDAAFFDAKDKAKEAAKEAVNSKLIAVYKVAQRIKTLE